MMIDEPIEKHKKLKISAERNNDKRGAFYSGEEHKQIAEWLEELKKYKEKPEGWMWDEAEMKGYNKAIDDFAEKLNAKCDGMIREKWNSNVAPISWAEAYADFKDDIEEIAEQLKAGGKNENTRLLRNKEM